MASPNDERAPSPGPVRLVVLNYNGGEHVVRALRCLTRLDWPNDQLQVVCVDNGSSDGSTEAIERELPEVEVRRLGHNGGFPSNNEAMRDLDGIRYVGLVNNDAFVDPGWLRPLVEALDERPDLGAVSSKILLAPRFADVAIEAEPFDPGPGDGRSLGVIVRGVEVEGRDQWTQAHLGSGGWGRESDREGTFEWSEPTAVLRVPLPEPERSDGVEVVVTLQARRPTRVSLDGGEGPVEVEVGTRPTRVSVVVTSEPYDVVNNVGSKVFEDGAGADIGFLERDEGQYDDPTEVFAWCGGSVLMRPEYLADVGLFDERFFLYYEDTDLSWRGRRRGWCYRTAPDSRVRHIHAASSGEGSEVFAYHVERNRLLMLVKNAPARMVWRQVVRYLLVTASYARRDVVRPMLAGRRPTPTMVRRRITSFIGFLRLLGPMLADRRQLRGRQLVPDDELAAWLVRR
jgi:GT2 family glycosyltransferase